MDVNSSQQVMKLNLNSSVSEFTRRKNWSTSILDCLRDVVHVLNNDLRFVYCSAASSEFLGYKPSELVNHAFTEYLHVDDIDMFVREFRNCKTSTQTFKCSYRFLRKDGKYTTLETNGTFYRDCLFGNARKVPSDNARSIDLFLDLKMENELLQKKLALLKNQHHQRETSANSDQTMSSTSMTTGNDEGDDSSDDFDDYNISANAPNVYTLGVNSSYDINESLALFTGLRYDLGERSSGISLGLEGGQLTNVDVDKIMSNPIIVSNNDEKPMERTKSFSDKPRPSKKKRVDNSEVPKICTDCGTTDAPEWRRGPSGPKTLCNACGLRWSKTKKKLETV